MVAVGVVVAVAVGVGMSARRQGEADLKRAIMAALTRAGFFAFRNEQGRRRFVSFGCGIGSPDIFVVLKPTGRLVGLEAKVGTEKPTPEQAEWGKRLVVYGGSWHVVRSVSEAMNAVRWDCLPP